MVLVDMHLSGRKGITIALQQIGGQFCPASQGVQPVIVVRDKIQGQTAADHIAEKGVKIGFGEGINKKK